MAKGRGGFIGQDGLNAPDSPTGVSGTGGNTQVDVSFTAPTDVGGSAITGYRVTDSTGSHGASGSSSPITVTGLTNDTSYTFNVWAINAFGYSAPSDSTGSVTPSFQRAVIAGGWNGSENNVIDYVSITSTGNATDFGDLVITRRNYGGGIGSTTRGVFTGGYNPSVGPDAASMDYITFATTGNAADFGDLSVAGQSLSSTSGGNTRSIFTGRKPDNSSDGNNVIDYVTIASTGNATDFGDLTVARSQNAATSNSHGGVQ